MPFLDLPRNKGPSPIIGIAKQHFLRTKHNEYLDRAFCWVRTLRGASLQNQLDLPEANENLPLEIVPLEACPSRFIKPVSRQQWLTAARLTSGGLLISTSGNVT